MLESNVGDLIRGQELLRMPLDSSVSEAATHMVDRHVGAVLIYEGKTLRGTFTERDMLERVVVTNLTPGEIAIKDVMTSDPASISADETVLHAIFAMKERMTRHLLVKERDEVIGIVSVTDLLRAVVDSSLDDRRRTDDLWEGFPV